MKKIKIGQIGTSHDHAADVFETICYNNDIFEVVGYARPEDDEDHLYDIRKGFYEKYPEMTVEELLNYPGLDAVTIETDEKNLTKYAQMAADKGLHMHMDKPGGESYEAYEKLINTVKEKNLVFHTGYMYRYNPGVERIREVIKEGKLGEIYSVEAHMDCEHITKKRKWLGRFKGGMMFYLGCHLVDLILQFAGTPEKVIPMNKCIGSDGVDSAEDFGMAVLEYKNGISFAKTSAKEPGGFYRRQLVVCGTKGTVELKPFEFNTGKNVRENYYTDVKEVYSKGPDEVDWGEKGNEYRIEGYHRYDHMMQSFAKMVRGEVENPYTYDYELQLYKTVLKACGYEI